MTRIEWQAGAIFDVPASHYPIEILKVGIGYGSLFGGSPQVLEQAIHIYGAGLPNPGAPIFTLDGPQLTDGVINEFNLEPILGEIIIDSGPFSVTLQFLEDNVGNEFHPTAIHDGNGCQPGKNLIQIDTDYEIYEGQVGSYYSHGLKLCSTGGASGAIVFPAAGNTYYLVVPANATAEGSYGVAGNGVERPPGIAACKAQQAGACTP
ncbi:MAG: hypothetical protein E2P01_09160 [Acidobacteria bacterium]|nr:MAG: hypothetical protein E2P01_09160 [Acidobacteriota bacterium]